MNYTCNKEEEEEDYMKHSSDSSSSKLAPPSKRLRKASHWENGGYDGKVTCTGMMKV